MAHFHKRPDSMAVSTTAGYGLIRHDGQSTSAFVSEAIQHRHERDRAQLLLTEIKSSEHEFAYQSAPSIITSTNNSIDPQYDQLSLASANRNNNCARQHASVSQGLTILNDKIDTSSSSSSTIINNDCLQDHMTNDPSHRGTSDMDGYYSEPDTHAMVGCDLRDLASSSPQGLGLVTMRWHDTGKEQPPKGVASEIPRVARHQSLITAPSSVDAGLAVDGEIGTAMDEDEVRAYRQHNSMTTRNQRPPQHNGENETKFTRPLRYHYQDQTGCITTAFKTDVSTGWVNPCVGSGQ